MCKFFRIAQLENLGNVRQMPSSGVLFLLKLPAQAKTLTLNLLKFNPERRPSAETALQDVFLEKFYLQACQSQAAESECAMAASDYRAMTPDFLQDCWLARARLMWARLAAEDQIHAMIVQRRKLQQELLSWFPDFASVLGPWPRKEEASITARRGRQSLRRVSSRFSDASVSSFREGPQVPWSHESGAAAPPSTPK
eukprot:s1917_g3.t1